MNVIQPVVRAELMFDGRIIINSKVWPFRSAMENTDKIFASNELVLCSGKLFNETQWDVLFGSHGRSSV